MHTEALAHRLLAELRLVATEGGGGASAVAAARWVGAHRTDVATHPVVSGSVETAEVLDLVAHVLLSLQPAPA